MQKHNRKKKNLRPVMKSAIFLALNRKCKNNILRRKINTFILIAVCSVMKSAVLLALNRVMMRYALHICSVIKLAPLFAFNRNVMQCIKCSVMKSTDA